MREEGRELGIEQGLRSALVATLMNRGFAIDAALRARIESMHDRDTLLRWVTETGRAPSLAAIRWED